jgi:hypothetical protein
MSTSEGEKDVSRFTTRVTWRGAALRSTSCRGANLTGRQRAGPGKTTASAGRAASGAKAPVNVRSASFADEAKLIGHFEKHGAEFGAKSSIEYLQVGKDIMQGGDKVQYLYKGEMRTGYVQFMGNSSRGDAKYGFVGINSDGAITKIHVESGKSFWKMLNGDPKDKTIRPVP